MEKEISIDQYVGHIYMHGVNFIANNYHYGSEISDISDIFQHAPSSDPSIIHQMIHCITYIINSIPIIPLIHISRYPEG